MVTLETCQTADQTLRELRRAIDLAVADNGGSTKARKPAHRVQFHWPPHPISYSFRVLTTDWSSSTSFEAHGETFSVEVARTPFGVFGRCQALWHEDRGETFEQMLANLRASAEPLFQRQLAISRALGREGRFTGLIQGLSHLDLLKLLYCDDRDVANEAKIEIEKHGSNRVFFPSLVEIVTDRRHPNRRSAQWCALDLFEDLATYCDSEEEELAAVRAMRALIWDAEDDYARTIYKAGVVLGGHLPYTYGGPILIECLEAPSRIGRRAAIHGLFHVVEWMPSLRQPVIAALRKASQSDPEPILRAYAKDMADDVALGDLDHAPDPVFPDEL